MKPPKMMIPTALDLEELVLGAMLVDSHGYFVANNQQRLSEEDFYDTFCKSVFSYIEAIIKENGKVDLATVGMRLMADGGDVFKLSELTNKVASTANLEYHVVCLKQVAMRRQLLFSSSKAMQMAADRSNDVFDIVQLVQSEVLNITESLTKTAANTTDMLNHIADIALNHKPFERFFMPSGLQSLDEAGLYGVEDRDIICIGADAGVGKTALALNLAIQFLEAKKHIAFFSYEMCPEDLILRIISIKTGLSMREMQEGKLAEYDKVIFLDAQKWLKDRLQYLHCFDCAGMSVEMLRSKALALSYQKQLSCIFVDYVQLIAAPPRVYDQNVKQEYNCEKLQHLKKELGCGMVLLSQLRKTKLSGRPTASDLKGAQVLEAMCTKIILLDSLYKKGVEYDEAGDSTMGKIDVYVDKNRNGQIFNATVKYIGYCYKFEDLEHTAQAAPSNNDYDFDTPF